MSDLVDIGICQDYVVWPLTILGYLLLIFSELLGMRSNKKNKCTSVLQAISAFILWVYWRMRGKKVSLRSYVPTEPQNPAEPEENSSDAETTVVDLMTINYPTWRKHPHPEVPLEPRRTVLPNDEEWNQGLGQSRAPEENLPRRDSSSILVEREASVEKENSGEMV